MLGQSELQVVNSLKQQIEAAMILRAQEEKEFWDKIKEIQRKKGYNSNDEMEIKTLTELFEESQSLKNLSEIISSHENKNELLEIIIQQTREKDIKDLEPIFRLFGSILKFRDTKGNTPLHFMALYSYLEELKAFAEVFEPTTDDYCDFDNNEKQQPIALAQSANEFGMKDDVIKFLKEKMKTKITRDGSPSLNSDKNFDEEKITPIVSQGKVKPPPSVQKQLKPSSLWSVIPHYNDAWVKHYQFLDDDQKHNKLFIAIGVVMGVTAGALAFGLASVQILTAIAIFTTVSAMSSVVLVGANYLIHRLEYNNTTRNKEIAVARQREESLNHFKQMSPEPSGVVIQDGVDKGNITPPLISDNSPELTTAINNSELKKISGALNTKPKTKLIDLS